MEYLGAASADKDMVSKGYVDAGDAETAEGIGRLVRPNLLDNWYFVGGGSQQGGGQFPINQRGKTSYTGVVYGIDRWATSGATLTATVQSDSIRLQKNTAKNNPGFLQAIENEGLEGTQVTVSVLYKGSFGASHIRIITASKNEWFPATASTDGIQMTSYTTTLAKGSAGQFSDMIYFGLQVVAATPTSEYIDVIAVKVELGDTQTLAHNEGSDENPVWVLNEIPNYEEQLARCQRFAVELAPYTKQNALIGVAPAGSSTNCYVYAVLPTTMRVKPSIAYSGTWNLTYSSSSSAVSAISVDVFMGNALKLRCTSSGLSSANVYALTGGSSDDSLFLSADL